MLGNEVHRLHLARVHAPAGHPDAGAMIGVYAFLILTGNGAILVDTGVGEGNSFIEELYHPRRTPLVDALASQGLVPSDVTAVVNSHLHFDHCGGNRFFPGRPVYVQARELAAARDPAYTVADWVAPDDVGYRAIEGDHEISPGIRLLSTPGHTPGHQSVLIEEKSETVLIAAQAAYTAAEFEGGGDTREAHEGLGNAYLASISRLKALRPDAVLFSHDATVWRPYTAPST